MIKFNCGFCNACLVCPCAFGFNIKKNQVDFYKKNAVTFSIRYSFTIKILL
jgi:hypothetical protein